MLHSHRKLTTGLKRADIRTITEGHRAYFWLTCDYYFLDVRLTNVEAVILDEVHYLSDISRGTVWEETIIYCPPEVRLVCLSATVANAEELADWIAQVRVSSWFLPFFGCFSTTLPLRVAEFVYI